MDHLKRCLALAAAIAIVGCASVAVTRDPRSLESPEERRYHDLVATLANPAMEGRGVGTEGLDRTRDLIADRFKTLGLQPAFGSSYTQPFPIKLGVTVKEQQLWIIRPNGKKYTLTPDSDFRALGVSSNAQFDAPLVFVGYGAVNKAHHYDSYAGLAPGAVKGKIVIVFRYEPMTADHTSQWAGKGDVPGQWTDSASFSAKAKLAAEHGAVALCVVNPPGRESGSLQMALSSLSGEHATLPVFHISPETFRQFLEYAGQDHSREAVDKLQALADTDGKALIDFGALRLAGKVEMEFPMATAYNVAAVLPGHGPLADQYIIVGAHYDHLGYGGQGSLAEWKGKQIHPGADDNASGTAGMLTLASWLHETAFHTAGPASRGQTPASQPADSPPERETRDEQRSVLFVAFSGEERGLLGSAYLLRHLDDLHIQKEQIAAMINMDMIGRMKDERLIVSGVGTADGLKELVAVAAQDTGLNIKTRNTGLGPSDHASFYLQSIPVLFLFTGGHEDYHRPTDTADKINAVGAMKVMTIARRLIESLRVDPQRLAFKPDEAGEEEPLAHASGAGGATFLGVMPDYGAEDSDTGVLIQGVTPGSPAAKAGLKGGDTLTRWNNVPLKDLRELARLLAAAKPGDAVKIQVNRNERILDLDVTLGQRE